MLHAISGGCHHTLSYSCYHNLTLKNLTLQSHLGALRVSFARSTNATAPNDADLSQPYLAVLLCAAAEVIALHLLRTRAFGLPNFLRILIA